MTTTTPKQKVSVSLDADIVAELESEGPLSTQVNEALRAALHHRRHLKALTKLLDELDRIHGPLDTPEDKAAIARYIEMFS
jgi:hypothetical protein